MKKQAKAKAKTKTIRSKAGRPRKFTSPKEMQEAIDLYFDECQQSNEPLTIEGLAEALDIDRRSLLNYEKQSGYEEFFPTIRRAKGRVQRNLVTRGLKGANNPTLTIFLLKNNHGYEDRSINEVKEERVIKGLSKEQVVEILSDEE